MMEWIVSSSLLILVVLFLRAALGKRIGAGLRYGLWGVVLARLLIPVAFFSLAVTPVPTIEPPEALREESIYVLPVESRPAEESNVRFTEEGEVERFGDPSSFGYPRLEDEGRTVTRYAEKVSPLQLLCWLWAAGSGAVALMLIVANVRFTLRLRRVRRPLEGTAAPVPVYAAPGLPSPCLMGLLRPAVYVTEEAAANPAMLRHVLAHELTHYGHRDHLWSVLRGAALAAHWWNPLVWLAVVCSRRDGELACDEGALKRLGDGERAAYGETLLALVTAKSRPADLLSFATTMTGGKRSLRERIQRIACKPRRLISAMVLVIVVVSLSALVAFGQAKAAPSEALPFPSSAWKSSEITVSEVGAPNICIRYIDSNGSEDVIGAPIPAPREWADDDLAERNQAQYLPFSPHIWAELVSPTDGWLVACYGRGEAADTYVYKTADGGMTWTEVSMPGTGWHIADVGFLSPERLIVAQQLLDGEAPCLITKDGGETWEEIELADVQAFSIDFAGPNTRTIVMEVGRYEEGPTTCYMRSPDMGDTWIVSYPTYPNTTVEADLDHDGALEKLSISRSQWEYYERWTLLWLSPIEKPDKPIAYDWYAMAASVHPGWTSFYLCRMDGEDYLLQYTPYMSTGLCEYSYKLFYLTDKAEEVVVQENFLEFDINFEQDYADRHQFDPKAIAAFMEEINALLANSELLINTDETLQETFHKEGRLYDSLGWLDGEEYGFSREENRSLLEELELYEYYAQDHPDDTWSPLADLLLTLTEDDIRMFDGDTSKLVRCLKAAERGSRFYTWDSEADAHSGNGAGETDYTILTLSLADGSTLWLYACEEKPSVLMILETSDSAVSAFYTAPELRALIIGPALSFREQGTGVLISGLDASYVEWLLPTEFDPRGSLYYADPAFLGPAFEGKRAEGNALWAGEDQINVNVTVDDPQRADGTVSGPYARFVVALDSGTVVDRNPDAAREDEMLELTEEEMVDMARVLAGLMTAAEVYYNGRRTD